MRCTGAFLVLTVLSTFTLTKGIEGLTGSSTPVRRSRRLLYSLEGTNMLDMTGLVGDTVHLPCSVNTEKCGELHSIKWYRGSSRIFVFSEKAKISRSEGDYANRAELHYSSNDTSSQLTVKQLDIADEAVYKCEITYLEVREGCQVVQFINLTTLIKPEFVRMSKGEDEELANGTRLGPFSEGDELTLICESGGGKPVPSVQWWNGTTLMKGEYSSEQTINGVGTGKNRVRFKVGRGDLGAKYECRATNLALPAPMVMQVLVEVNVRPLKLELTGMKDHVIQGSKVVLQCTVSGARPAASITWFNGTSPMEATSKPTSQADGTYDTVSELVFTASRFENEQTLSCEGTNDIMKARKDSPMRHTVYLEVLYPPIVTVNQENVTVNESTDVLLLCNYEANPSTLKSVKWLRDDEEVDVSNLDHYEGGTTEQTSLQIKNTTRYDHGLYVCVLENQVGASESINSVFVSIYFKPIVNLTMIPTTPVSELDQENITLVCGVVAGNPETLLAVRWFLDGQLLKELPDCSSVNSSFCDVDPSKLLLEVVGRSFHGNYSCIGMNEAGWGPISQDTELIVYYPPGPTSLVYSPQRVIKRGTLHLSCSVDDPGRPDNTTFRWLRGVHPVVDVTTGNWTIDPVTLETESNFTCIAVNLGGESKSATQYIQVLAPPTFIERLPPYYGALMTAQSISITCRVECFPECSITWKKNGVKLETGPHSRYSVQNTIIPPDPRTNDFQSIQSILIWNMTAWPGGQLDRISDKANYTCESTKNDIGAGVKSTTFFGVEYPPENVTVSNKVVNVIEGNIPERVLCSAKAYPEASYQWKRDGESDIISKGNSLIINTPVHRKHGGDYLCEAYNRHGKNTEKTLLNVLYKPECGITQTEVDGKLVLICTAHANPTEVDFTWKIKHENETIEENIEKNGLQSLLTLETRVENFRTYLCYANNSVGMSIPCERDVTGNISWWRKLENDNIMIVVAIIAGAVIMVLLICIIIILVCRRKRASDKYNNPVELEDRENPEGNSGSPQNTVTPKWPLRPGVLVHVNTNHSLSSSRLANVTSSTPNGATTTSEAQNHKRRRRAVSLANLNESQHSRANRIRQMFSSDQRNKYRCDTLPGVIHSKNGVVTFKKIDATTQESSRKRKKPGTGPNPSATKDKSDLNSSPNDALLQPDNDRAFYENLPFHGMQNPPNKSTGVIGTSGENRPPSELSQYGGSSGYGSTRSHTSPHINFSARDTSKTPDSRKFLTVRPGKRSRNWPQFRSLRSLRSPKKGTMGPLKENSPEQKNERNNNDGSEGPSPALPVPAPRKFSPNNRPPLTKHTYQNVPVPIIPNTAQKTEIPCATTNEMENQQCQLTNQMLGHQKLLLNSTSNGRHSLKKKKQQHCIRKNSGRDECVYPSHRSAQQLPSPPPPPPTYLINNGGGILYTDLSQHRSRPSLPHIPLYTPPNSRNHTDYAIIKFHDVGQEIDV